MSKTFKIFTNNVNKMTSMIGSAIIMAVILIYIAKIAIKIYKKL